MFEVDKAKSRPGKLKHYCQACRKQCVDGNGWKQHCLTSNHLNRMTEFNREPEKFISLWSSQFEAAILSKVHEMGGSNRPVSISSVYVSLCNDPEHPRLSGSRWDSVEDFAKDASNRGLFKYDEIDKSVLFPQQQVKHKERKRIRSEDQEDQGFKRMQHETVIVTTNVPDSIKDKPREALKLTLKPIVKKAALPKYNDEISSD